MPGKVLCGRESDARAVISDCCRGEGHVIRPRPITDNKRDGVAAMLIVTEAQSMHALARPDNDGS